MVTGKLHPVAKILLKGYHFAHFYYIFYYSPGGIVCHIFFTMNQLHNQQICFLVILNKFY